MQHAKTRDTVPKEPNRAQSAPSSRGSPPRSDGDDTGVEVAYDQLFGTPALQQEQHERTSPFEVDTPDGEPPDPPPLGISAYPPERAGYELAFRAAYEFPHALMLVMRGIRKGLKRGKKAATEAGGQRDE